MTTKFIKIFLFFVVFIFCGCVQESVLSDVEINDPSIIQPVITIEKSKTGSTLTQSVTAWIYDKNHNAVELKNRAVLINGQKMLVKKLIEAPYYSGIELISDIHPGQKYNFEIKLNSQKSYSASATIQAADLSFLDVPVKHNKAVDMPIS